MSTPTHPEQEPLSFLHLRPTKAQKARWVRAAQASPFRRLEDWVFDALDSAAEFEEAEAAERAAEGLQER